MRFAASNISLGLVLRNPSEKADIMKITLIIALLMLAGCATLRPPKSSIWEPRTEYGRSFKARYQTSLGALLVDLRSIREVGDIVVGLWLGAGADSSSKYLGANLGTYNKYNTLR